MTLSRGRPTDYSEDVLKKSKEYLKSCQDTELQQTVGMSAKGTELFKTKIVVKLPTKGGLAKHLGVHRDTLYEWGQKHDDFSDILEELGSEQEDRLINGALGGDYNSTITKVLLTKHGYREGLDTTTNDKDIPVGSNVDLDKLADSISSKLKEDKV